MTDFAWKERLQDIIAKDHEATGIFYYECNQCKGKTSSIFTNKQVALVPSKRPNEYIFLCDTCSNKWNDPNNSFRIQLEQFWNKCPYCGAHNGLFSSQLEEHRSRCRYIGNANSFDMIRPKLEQDVQKVQT